jgi:molybdate transport system ATP-binding protein
VSLRIDVRHDVGAFHLEVRVEIGRGLTALVGPSGAGKTTLLNVVAGLVRPARCLVRLDDAVLADTTTGAWQPPYRRGLGYVFQEARLFPHLTVRQNLHYARWAQARGAAARPVAEVVALLNLGGLLARYPSRLSGGEQQRVALGRALLASPRLLLLDEPLASIDAPHRDAILPYLDRVRADHAIPAIYVTHAWTEISGRADQVIELADGRVAFTGSVADADARR